MVANWMVIKVLRCVLMPATKEISLVQVRVSNIYVVIYIFIHTMSFF